MTHDLLAGLRDAAGMVWMTWWPLVLGFSLAGLVQALVPRGGLESRLGRTAPGTVGLAAVLGLVSSSCSYAASAMARALFSRGASWTNAVVLMVASTNLVVELGVVLWVLLGAPFLVAQLVGGVVMVIALAVLAPLAFPTRRVTALRARVEPGAAAPVASGPPRWREPATYAAAVRYARGDLTMVWRELAVGFLIAGYLSADVPTRVWRDFFVPGHGLATVAENVIVAPVVAALSCVCSVGNVPLAATLWSHGVAFGGVVAFVFADLLTLPLLAIYRRLYGAGAALRLAGLLYGVVVVAGLAVDGLFALVGAVPTSHRVTLTSGTFPLGATLVLNALAVALAGLVCWGSRRAAGDDLATDPVCGMTVRRADAPATLATGGATHYFCSMRCRDRFAAGAATAPPDAGPDGATDPVCGMRVSRDDAAATLVEDGVTYYFCCAGCRDRFAHDAGVGGRA